MVTLDRELGGLSPATELYDGELLPQMYVIVLAIFYFLSIASCACNRLSNISCIVDAHRSELLTFCRENIAHFSPRHERWGKGLTEFYDPVTDMFNVSKIPDVFDLARYDYCHNLLADIRPTLTATFVQARDLAHIVVPQGGCFW